MLAALLLLFSFWGVGACPCRDVSQAPWGRKKKLIAPCFEGYGFGAYTIWQFAINTGAFDPVLIFAFAKMCAM